MKRLSGGLAVAAFFVPAAGVSADRAAATRRPDLRPYCHHRLFTVAQDERAARAVYRGTRSVSHRNLRMLGQIERCQRNPQAQRFVRAFNHRQAAAHDRAVLKKQHPWSDPVTASWFDDSGQVACSSHYTYGFATLDDSIPCGDTIEMMGPNGQVVEATREDSGPYVGGRKFDLNPSLRDALGCGDLCSVRWRSR